MGILNCVIIEDEILSRKSLENLCSKNEKLNVQGSFENGKDALDYLHENPVELLFLDIEMPDMKGWELLDSLSYIPLVVVISANKEYAYDAFKYNVTDFIEKPISVANLNAALLKVNEQHEARKKMQSNKEMYIKANGKLVRIEFDQIMYIENLADYVKICLANTSHVIYCTMKHLESRLPSKDFMKVHRSYIINMSKINFIEDNDISIDNKLIPIARSQKTELLDRLNLL
jgi:DNA-binding LytR/AlgR family response regulator